MALGRADEMLDSLSSLPVLPPLADELVSMAISSEGGFERVLAVVEQDPVLAAIVLRMVNSAAFALSAEVTELSRAVVLLGAAHVRSLALAAAMSALSAVPDADERFAHSFSTACTARLVAVAGRATWEETAFAAGILHDIGELVVVALDAEPAEDGLNATARIAIERTSLGTDHAELGAALARRWSIPEVLCAPIEGHHGDIPHMALPAEPTGEALTAIVAAAECVLDELDGTAHSDGRSAADALLALGLGDPDAIIARAGAVREAHFSAMGMATAGAQR
ncbi:MAG TPA: HDOD domain-containing protein [Acidimicrobiales bacterium]|nr:HDOD domain-containing protein [Acidimicrobiales bacterium]